MLHDIELAVQKGRARQEAEGSTESKGLEVQLREVGATVSSAGGQRGLLDKVKDFNAYLEAVLTVL